MTIRLRRRIVYAALIPILGFGGGTVAIVYREVSQEIHDRIRTELLRSATAVEQTLMLRAHGLRNTAEAVARDPRVIAALEAGATEGARIAADALAAELNARARFTLFELRDVAGTRVASAGDDGATTEAQEPLLEDALLGRSSSGILIRHGYQYQATARPVLAHGRVVGALILGDPLSADFAAQLSELTGSEITFIAGAAATASTLERPADARALVATLLKPPPGEKVREAGVPFELRGTDHRFLVLSRPLPESRAELEQVMVVQRAIDLETAFLANARDHLLELALTAILASLLIGFFVADGMARRIERASRALEELSRGNREYPLPRAGGDEIGDLLRSVDRLQKRIRVGQKVPGRMDHAA